MKKACIFDLDGTLTSTVESIARPFNRVLEHFGLQPRPVEENNFYAGDGVDTTLQRALAAAGDSRGRYLEEGIPLAREWLGQDPLYHVKPYPHMVEALTELREKGIRIAVFSNKPHQAAIEVVQTIFGRTCFDWIQGQTAQVPKKPDPTGARMILDRLDVTREECLYFGDTNTDMETGHRAGIYTVGVSWGFRPRRELEANHADCIIDSPEEIPGLVEKFQT